MSKLFDANGKEIGNLGSAGFGQHEGSIFGQNGLQIGELSRGGLFCPAPRGFPGDQPLFNARGQRIGHISKGTAAFGGKYEGPVYSQSGQKLGDIRLSDSGSTLDWGVGGDILASLLAIYIFICAIIIVGIPIAATIYIWKNRKVYEEKLSRKIMRTNVLVTAISLLGFVLSATNPSIGKFFLLLTVANWILGIIAIIMIPAIVRK